MKLLIAVLLLLSQISASLAQSRGFTAPKRPTLKVIRTVGSRGCQNNSAEKIEILGQEGLAKVVHPKFVVATTGISEYRVTLVQPRIYEPIVDRWIEANKQPQLIEIKEKLQLDRVYRLTLAFNCPNSSNPVFARITFIQVEPSLQLEKDLLKVVSAQKPKIYAQYGLLLDAAASSFKLNPQQYQGNLIQAVAWIDHVGQ
jgi:hypothetical protein